MQEQVPPTPDTDEELEGQVAHRIALGVASHSWEPKVGDNLPHAGRVFEIDDDMIDGARLYAEEAQFHSDARYEDAVDVRHVIPECWGTPDYWRLIGPNTDDLRIAAEGYQITGMVKSVDYKYGFRHVEVFENPQLIAYTLGVQARLQLPWDTPACLTIVQPRSYHHEGPVREWRESNGRPLTLRDLYQFAQQTIVPAVNEALSDSPRTISGPHCVDCKARHQCPAYRKTTANVLRYVGTAQPDIMSPEAVGVELRLVKWAIKMLEGREAGLQAHAQACINAGLQIPYWRMGATMGRLKWRDGYSAEQLATTFDLIGADIRKPQQLITPSNTIREKGIDKRIVELYAHRPPGVPKLIPDDTTQFRKVFGHSK